MPTRKAEYRVANLDCDGDAAVIERGLRSVPGVLDMRVYRQAAKVSVQYDPDTANPDAIAEKLQTLGFPAELGRVETQRPRPLKNPKVLASIASGVLLFGGWLVSLAGAPQPASFGVYVAAILVGGYYFGREAVEELVFEREIGVELLMGLAAVTATVMGAAGEGAMLVFLYSISEAAEGYTEEKTRSAVKALMDLSPKTALVRRDGSEIEIPVEELTVGEVFIVKPGQAIATDGEVIAGASSVNQSPVTGESAPVDKGPGDLVFAGSLNGEGSLEVRATKTSADNTIARMIQLVEEAEERKGLSQKFIERFGHRYSPAVLLVGVLIAVVPPLVLGASWANWISRATVFIVAAAPCALVISIPVTLVASLGTGARWRTDQGRRAR
jgi:cation transport ATPase